VSEKYIPLHQLPIGKTARVKELVCDGNIRRRMLDLGLIHETKIEALQKSPQAILLHIILEVRSLPYGRKKLQKYL